MRVLSRRHNAIGNSKAAGYYSLPLFLLTAMTVGK
jgi:hypothetical protein